MYPDQRVFLSLGIYLLAHLGLTAVHAVEPVTASDHVGHALPENVTADWWQAVTEDVRQSEYCVTWQDRTFLADVAAAFQAPNRAHNLRTYFTPQGIRVIPRTGDVSSWQWGAVPTAFGRAENMRDVPTAELVSCGNRFEYRRGNLVEWYLNDARGLEQGFTWQSPPDSWEASSPLRIELRIIGNLAPVLGEDGTSIHFQTADGVSVLDYGDLEAVDAQGRALPARLAVKASQLVIEVDDVEAVYPITIDPLATSASWTAESNQTEAAFGYSVATAGDVNGDGFSDVLVGSPNYDGGDADEGLVRLYLGSAGGLGAFAWSSQSDQAGAYYGNSVATAGDVNGDGYSDVIVGAPLYDNGEADEGVVFVFHGSSSGLSAPHDWFAEFDYPGRRFGDVVSTAGDVNGDGYSDVIIEAPANDQAYLWLGSASGLGADGTPSNADWFADISASGTGGSVGTAGDVNGDGYSDVILGTARYSNGETWEGGAFIWYGGSGGLGATGTEANADWTVESDQVDAYLGTAVATAGDINGDGYADVVVGATGYDGSYTDEGAAFLYVGSASGPSTTPDWTYEGGADDLAVGRSVATAGDINGDGYADVVVGAALFTPHVPTLNSEGEAYVFFGSSIGLPLTPDWSEVGGQPEAAYGHSVATAGDVDGDGFSDVLIGSPGYSNFPVHEGRAFLYSGSPSGLSIYQKWTYTLPQNGALFGSSVATAGDVNGDGYADVIIGAPGYDGGSAGEGGTFVFYGSSAGPASSPDWTAESNQTGAELGCSVASAGDVNNDGYSDVIVGAQLYDGTGTDDGAAFLWLGSPTGLGTNGTPGNADWSTFGGQVNCMYGHCVASAGDVNGDGYLDVIVGAPFRSDGESSEGRAYVYDGTSAGPSTTVSWSAQSNDPMARMGLSVATAGDIDGDGYSDIIIGAPWYDNGTTDEGVALVWHGSSSGLGADGTPANADWIAESNQASALLGISVGTAGDVDGDGYADVIVGASMYQNSYAGEGAAFVWYGAATGLGTSGTPANSDWATYGGQADSRCGNAVAVAGDVNGDGYADVLVGARLYDAFGTYTDSGRAEVFHGSAVGLETTASWTRNGGYVLPALGTEFGGALGSAGDVNGDGYADVILGSREDWSSNIYTDEGNAALYYGGSRDIAHLFHPGGGPDLLPRQLRADDTAPIAQLGKSDGEYEFRLAAKGRTPFGRGEVKLEWEVKSLGVLFNGISTSASSAWTDTDVNGTIINEVVTGLTAATVYHWRVRLLYHPAQVPFQPHSRWYTMPWNGWQEADLRTSSTVVATDEQVVPPLNICRVLPNPFNATTTFRFQVNGHDPVSLDIFDVAGRHVTRLVDRQRFEAGLHDIVWHGDDSAGEPVASGSYFFRYVAGSDVVRGKLMLVK